MHGGQARRILLMAFGENKAGIAARCVEGTITSQVPASFLQEHPNASVLLDLAASSGMNTARLSPVAASSWTCSEALRDVDRFSSGVDVQGSPGL